MTTLQDTSPMQTSPLSLEDLAERLATSPSADLPQWRIDLRDRAWAALQRSGMPKRRDEEWRQMNLKSLEATQFQAPSASTSIERSEIAPFLFPDANCIRLVFVNGTFSETLSDMADLPDGLTVQPLHQMQAEAHAEFEAKAGTLVDVDEHPFAALNTIMFEDGVVIHIAEGVKIDRPIHIINAATDSTNPQVISPRTLVIAESSSNATIIEDCIGIDSDTVYLRNSVAEHYVAKGARLHHYLIERESPRAFHFSNKAMHIEENAQYTSHSITMGASIVRNDLWPHIAGTGVGCVLNGVSISGGEQLVDTHVRMRHAEPECTSNQYFRGILDGRAQGNFTGRIIVDRGAQKTDAVQSSQNLLLSEDARAHTKPQLEIFADDVRCTHGATIGQLDDDSLFYLRARGMSETLARSMLVYAFASEGIDLMELQPIRDLVKTTLMERLPRSSELQEVF